MPGFLVLLPWITAAKLAWKWGTAVGAFTGAYHSKLYSRKQLKCLLALWVALTGGVIVSAVLACGSHPISTPIIFFLAVCLLPGGELAACAANLAQTGIVEARCFDQL